MNRIYNFDNKHTNDNANEEISMTIYEYNIEYESDSSNPSINFFGISSGITYTNLDTSKFNEY